MSRHKEYQTAAHLGRRMGTALEPGPNMTARQLYVETVGMAIHHRSMSSQPFRPKLVWIAAAMILVVAGFGMWLGLKNDTTMRYRVGTMHTSVASEQWVENSGSTPLPIVFANGSRFEIAPGAAARVKAVQKDQVRIDLNRGTISARVRGNGHTKWAIAAGPYLVTVVGTQFDVSWDSVTAHFSTVVHKGTVAVSGKSFSTGAVTLSAGQRISADNNNILIAHANEATSPQTKRRIPSYSDQRQSECNQNVSDTDDTSDGHPQQTDSTNVNVHHQPARTGAPELRRNPTEKMMDWRQALHDKNWDLVIEHMNKEQQQRVINAADENDLWMMANSARNDRHTQFADRLFTVYRQRYPNFDRAATAAFLLGKSAYDQHGNPEQASRWLQLYLKESPGGFLREEALSRLVEAMRQQGDSTRTREWALKYIAEFPEGLYAKSARKIISR